MEKEIKNIIANIKTLLNDRGIILDVCDIDGNGLVLDTYDEILENIIIYELFMLNKTTLCAKSNWGLINLELALTDTDDWYSLEDIVKDLLDI